MLHPFFIMLKAWTRNVSFLFTSFEEPPLQTAA